MKNEHVSKAGSNKRLAEIDDYDLPPEVPLDPQKMKPNRFAGRVKLTHGGARRGAGRKPKPESLRTVRKTVTLYRSEIRFLKTLDSNLSRAIHKLLATKTR